MRSNLVLCLFSAMTVASLLACQPKASSNPAVATTPAPIASAAIDDTAHKAAPTNLQQLAQRLVNQSVGVKEGDIVLVSGGTQDQELLEDIAIEVRKLGAFPLLQLTSDRLFKASLNDVPEKFDGQTNVLGMKLAGLINVSIVLDSNLDESILAEASPKRVMAQASVSSAVAAAQMKNNIRSLEIGNELYPTDWRAKRYGMTKAELSKTFWEGVNVDYSDLQKRANDVKTVLAAGKELRITDSAGTNLKMQIRGRPVLASDGIISSDDRRKGGAASMAYLPAGEVFMTPVPGSTEGKLVRAKDYFRGKEMQNLTMTFAAGKLTSLTGEGPGFESFKALYDAAGDCKAQFALIDFGINPNVRLPADSSIGNWVPEGTVTVGLGNNTWAGGDTKCGYGYSFSLTTSTVVLDDKAIIDTGKLKI